MAFVARSLAWAMLALALVQPQPLSAQPSDQPQAFDQSLALSDEDLGSVTGKFVLANGAEIALTVVSETSVNNALVLRTVFKVDTGTSIQVFGRTGTTADAATARLSATAPAAAPMQATAATGVSVNFDRHSGTSTITPTYSAATGAAGVTFGGVNGGGAIEDAAARGLAPIALAAGAPAVATPDGTVALAALPRGSLVTLAGDQFVVSHLVGNAIASIVSNSANDRTIDTVTNVNIDLRDISAFTAGSSALRVDLLALDAARGMVR